MNVIPIFQLLGISCLIAVFSVYGDTTVDPKLLEARQQRLAKFEARSKGAMPITAVNLKSRDMYFRQYVRLLKEANTNSDITEKASVTTNEAVTKGLEDYAVLFKVDATYIIKNGYSYNLTIRKIKMNEAALEKADAEVSFGYINMLLRAERGRQRAFEEGLIDQQTFEILGKK